jgi:hypothetical protein
MNVVNKIAVAGLLAVGLAGCADNPFEVVQINCPAVAIVSNTGTVTHFQGDGRNMDDVLYNATISSLNSSCQQEGSIRFDVAFHINAEAGPKFKDDSITLPYYVVLLRDNHLITAKKVYQTTLYFSPGATHAAKTETIVQTFDNIDIASRYDYELLIGFQLSPEEVSYNALR